jgi:hypothetical protein
MVENNRVEDGWMDDGIRVEALQWDVINQVKIVTQANSWNGGILVQLRGNWGLGIELRTKKSLRTLETWAPPKQQQEVLKRLITYLFPLERAYPAVPSSLCDPAKKYF